MLKKVAIYYGYPSLVNHSQGHLDQATAIFSKFDYVVLGANIEKEGVSLKPKHEDHDNTASLIKQTSKTLFFGYVNLGLSNTKLPTSAKEIEQQVQSWKKMGAKGVFFDAAGFEFGVDRKRQNEAFQLTHKAELKVFVNAHKPEEIFEGHPKPVLKEGDLFLFEDFAFSKGQFQDPQYARVKSNLLNTYRKDYKVEVVGVSTFEKTPTSPTTEPIGALIFCADFFNLDGICISDSNYSASNNELFLFDLPQK